MLSLRHTLAIPRPTRCPTLPLLARHLASSPFRPRCAQGRSFSCFTDAYHCILGSLSPRHLARAQKRKAAKLAAAAGEAGGEDQVDAERAAAIEAEFQRAKERLTLRHRNSSRWARRALKRGQLNMDTGGGSRRCLRAGWLRQGTVAAARAAQGVPLLVVACVGVEGDMLYAVACALQSSVPVLTA